MKIIPVMHCFDNRYVIPAGVAFLSMLENANRSFFYKLYILHTDITEENQDKLKSIVSQFENASLEFINMDNRFTELFSQTIFKGHYSKEIYFKFLAPSIFPQYKKIIITDVDVVYQGDISKDFENFEDNENDYLAGVTTPSLKGSWLETFFEKTYEDFTESERKALLTGGGYWIFNLDKMRRDNCEQKFIEFAEKNATRSRQPEQDTVNLICYPHMKLLPLSAMVCTYLYDLYDTKNASNNDLVYSSGQLKEALENPVQVHYATAIKPWNTPDCTKADIWYSYLVKTPFFYEQMSKFKSLLKNDVEKYTLFGISVFRINKAKQGKARLFGFIPCRRK